MFLDSFWSLMGEEKEKKRRNPLSLVTRKGTKKVLGKWRKLENNTDVHSSELESGFTGVKLFGQPLELALRLDPSLDGIYIPAIVRQSIDYINEYGLDLEGIYRVSSPKSRLDELENESNARANPLHFCKIPITKALFRDAHEAAGLLKRFLRGLPEPLLPPKVEELAEGCSCEWKRLCTCGVSKLVFAELKSLQKPQRHLLAYLFIHAQQVIVQESKNKMGVPALGLLLQQVLDMQRRTVCLLLANASPILYGFSEGAIYFFDDVTIVPYVPPKSGAEVENWECEDRPRIEEEMEKQNKLLKCLHEQIQTVPDGDVKKALEERAWSVQQMVTVLRRRRRSVAEPTKNEENAESGSIRSFMLEEKQLLAIQTNLLEEIAAEKKQVASLCWNLAKLGYPTVQEIYPKVGDNTAINGDLADEILEEAARSTLVEEVARLKSECAILRANLELAQHEQNKVTRF